MASDWDARLAEEQARARSGGGAGGGSSSASSDDPMIYLGVDKSRARMGRPVAGRKVTGSITGPGQKITGFSPSDSGRDEQPFSVVLGLMHRWYGTDKYNDWQKKLQELQLLTPEQVGDTTTALGWWEKAVKMAADFQASGRGNVTPWDALEILAGDKAARDRRGIINAGGNPDGPPLPTTNSQVNLTDASTAKRLVREALYSRLGRQPTEEEFSTFTGLLNAAERANPSVTTTTYSGDGRSSSSTSGGGLNAAGFIDEQAMNLPDYKNWQAVGTYGPALFGALNSPVG